MGEHDEPESSTKGALAKKAYEIVAGYKGLDRADREQALHDLLGEDEGVSNEPKNSKICFNFSLRY